MTTPERPLPQPITTRTCVLSRDKIIRGIFLDKADVSHEDAVDNIAATAQLTGGRRFPVLVDLRRCRSQSAEARAYLAGPQALAVTLAVALVIENPLSRMIGNFYLGFNRPPVPTRLFNSVAEAEGWLSAFLSQGVHEG